ncbi:PssD/Cps14F family polysaccharide biosynthesis glycosyltransferase [Bacillus sp. JJ1521]|uniref:PssD/Cps14F family polysaccharide biosynthesis glycosyltransferase n=1 Tax=Bacillus sp. JJ1521 TaxID=3122957 RepID=UPI002FFDEEDB
MKSEKQIDVLLVSSTGGHFAQLMQIVKTLEEYNISIITEKNKTTDGLEKRYEINFLFQQDRKKLNFLFVFLLNLILSFSYLVKANPKVIISTGAGATLPLLFFGKLLGKKIIFIESFAKIHSPTLTGKIVYKFADKFYVQWESMLQFYPRAIFKGGIY